MLDTFITNWIFDCKLRKIEFYFKICSKKLKQPKHYTKLLDKKPQLTFRQMIKLKFVS